MTSQPTFISIGERAYKYIRQFSIKSIDDALVELITNANDAYQLSNASTYNIQIDIINPGIIKVRDLAIGLTSDGLEKCFLQIGDYTASTTSRGFFSRGAKDISAIGNVTFTTIKDGKYSQCVLDTDAYGNIVTADIDATDVLRESCGITGNNNGLEVTINLLPNFQNMDITKLSASISKLGTLRNIFKNTQTNFVHMREINSSNTIVTNKRITYNLPEGDLLLDMNYNIPNYEQYTGRFVVYKSKTLIPQPLRENQMEFGFLIEDNTSVYEVSTIDDRFRWNPYVNYLYGYIHCDAIHDMLIDYDTNGASTANPYPIIDPSRLSGINKQHPLIVGLLSIPLVRLDFILRELNTIVSSSSVSITELNDLLDELSNLGIDIIQQKNINVNWTPNYDANLIKAISDQRSNFINYEKSYVINNNYNTEEIVTNNYIKEQIINQSENTDALYVYDPNTKQLVPLKDLSLDNFNTESVNTIKLLPDSVQGILKTNPYIYKLDATGRNLEQLFVFENGSVQQNDTGRLNMQSRQFSIQFINDINIQTRYIIDNSNNAITAKINLNNPLVNKYLSLNQSSSDIVIGDISSTKSLLFMTQIVTDILTDLVVNNDIQTGKLILDADNYSNGRLALDYRNNIIATIEGKVDSMFQTYISENVTRKLTSVGDLIHQISTYVLSSINVPTDILTLHTTLQTTLQNVIE